MNWNWLFIWLAVIPTTCKKDPEPWDCGPSCTTQCAFVKEWDRIPCEDSCQVCDDRAFVRSSRLDAGSPGWLTDPGPVQDAGSDH